MNYSENPYSSPLGPVASVIGCNRCVIAADSPARWSAGLVSAGSHALLAPALRSLDVLSPSASLLGFPAGSCAELTFRCSWRACWPPSVLSRRALLASWSCAVASERLLPTAAGLLLCRPAPRTAMMAPAMLRLLDIQSCYTPTGHPVKLRFAGPPDTASLTRPPALLSRSPRFQDSPVLLPLTLSLTRPGHLEQL
jgi:hypothetical protein